MKSDTKSNLTSWVALVALAVGLFTGVAKAQNAYEGRFILPFEAHWGSTVLPAGDYTLTLPSAGVAPYVIFVRAEGKTRAIIMASGVEEKVAADHSRLNIASTGAGYAVESFEARDLGLTFTYAVSRAKVKSEARNRAPLRQVPVSTAGH